MRTRTHRATSQHLQARPEGQGPFPPSNLRVYPQAAIWEKPAAAPLPRLLVTKARLLSRKKWSPCFCHLPLSSPPAICQRTAPKAYAEFSFPLVELNRLLCVINCTPGVRKAPWIASRDSVFCRRVVQPDSEVPPHPIGPAPAQERFPRSRPPPNAPPKGVLPAALGWRCYLQPHGPFLFVFLVLKFVLFSNVLVLKIALCLFILCACGVEV